MLYKIKRRLYDILEYSKDDDWLTKVDDYVITTFIILNVIAVILETEESIYSEYKNLFNGFELVSIIIFTCEYVLRLWVCTEHENYKRPILGRLKFALTPLLLIDLFSFLPFYLPLLLPIDLRFIRAIRLFRLLRIFKLTRYFEALKTFGNVIKAKKEELVVMVMVVLLLLFLSSSLMYFVEHDAQPEAFASIPKSLWWGVVTLTTVGYGDIYPVTVLGKLIASIMALLGIGIFALPAGILASGFAEQIHKKNKTITCPHCGKQLD